MAKPGPKKGEGGRPRMPDPDWDELQRLARVHCTGDDCAYVLGIPYSRLAERVQEKYGITFQDYLKKEKEFIEFAVNMYIKYAEELEITSPEQHEYIVTELKKIKKRYLNDNETEDS